MYTCITTKAQNIWNKNWQKNLRQKDNSISWRPHHLIFNNGENNYTEYQQRNIRLEQHYKVTVILRDTYRTLHATEAAFTLLKHTSTILHDRAYGRQFKKVSIKLKGFKSSKVFSNHNAMRLEINYTRKFGEFTNIWILNNKFLTIQLVKEEITREIRRYTKIN